MGRGDAGLELAIVPSAEGLERELQSKFMEIKCALRRAAPCPDRRRTLQRVRLAWLALLVLEPTAPRRGVAGPSGEPALAYSVAQKLPAGELTRLLLVQVVAARCGSRSGR
jgi:hypothetical protein